MRFFCGDEVLWLMRMIFSVCVERQLPAPPLSSPPSSDLASRIISASNNPRMPKTAPKDKKGKRKETPYLRKLKDEITNVNVYTLMQETSSKPVNLDKANRKKRTELSILAEIEGLKKDAATRDLHLSLDSVDLKTSSLDLKSSVGLKHVVDTKDLADLRETFDRVETGLE
jgi:hypothetical protein